MNEIAKDFPRPIRIEFNVQQAVPALWACLTERKRLSAWWGLYVTLQAEMDGNFTETRRDQAGRVLETRGKITRLELPNILQFSWAESGWEKDWQTFVTFAFKQEQELLSRVVLLHTGWDSFPETPGRDLRYGCETRWREHLTNLRYHAELTRFL